MNRRRPRERRGSILVVTLWILALLSLFALATTSRIRGGIREATWSDREFQGRELLLSLGTLAVSRLLQDANEEIDAYSEAWGQPLHVDENSLLASFQSIGRAFDNLVISATPIDESGKVNVNYASEDLLSEVLREAGIVVGLQEMVSAIVDWRDADSVGFAESDYYYALAPSYGTADRDLQRIEELLFVEGIGPALVFGEDANRNGALDPEEDDGDLFLPIDNADGALQRGLIDLLTVYGEGIININGASEPVLRATLRTVMPPADAELLARRVVMQRRGSDGIDGTEYDKPFSDDQAIREAIGEEIYSQLVSVNVEFGFTSNAFRYLLEVREESLPYLIRGNLVAIREDSQLRVVEWREY